MKKLVASISLILSRKDSRFVVVVSTVLFFSILLFVENGRATYDVINFTSIPLLRRIYLAFITLVDIKNTFSGGSLILAVLGSFLGGINISLAYTYMKTRGEVILKSGLYSGVGLFFAFLGIGCAACGTAFLSIVLGLFGFSSMLGVLPYQGQEIGYIGLIFLSIATYLLAEKVSATNVC